MHNNVGCFDANKCADRKAVSVSHSLPLLIHYYRNVVFLRFVGSNSILFCRTWMQMICKYSKGLNHHVIAYDLNWMHIFWYFIAMWEQRVCQMIPDILFRRWQMTKSIWNRLNSVDLFKIKGVEKHWKHSKKSHQVCKKCECLMKRITIFTSLNRFNRDFVYAKRSTFRTNEMSHILCEHYKGYLKS